MFYYRFEVNIINKYICIHGHFYQPPRENPWLEEIEIEESAYPFHDWNERITDECYAPNGASRILDANKKIINIVNNYVKISSNFGPTLLSWLENNNQEVYQSILEADKESQQFFSGHGSVLAQVYNHVIMPLASSRDKRTEVIWGIKDFVYRFGRMPEGMWLSETAVDTDTLETLAEHGVLFTILAPHQAKRIRLIGTNTWIDVNKDTLDIGMPYICNLPSGKKISLFFYNAEISHEIAFQKILENGENFAKRLINFFPDNLSTQKLLSVATDGETYGHHHRFADMALAYALNEIETKNLAHITIYGEFLEKFPPTFEVSVTENTSWSCVHGIKRWEDNCGCRAMYACLISDTSTCYPIALQNHQSSKKIKEWDQKWRRPLRDAITWLNIQLSHIFETEMKFLFQDPWHVRDVYYELMVVRSPENIKAFFNTYSKRQPSPEEVTKSLKLLEMQKNALYMQTSCGWFFDDLAGIETVQIMMYASRAMQLARDVSHHDLEPQFINLLAKAESNLPEIGNGGSIYIKYVATAIFDIHRVAFQYAISSLINGKPDESVITTYNISTKSFRTEKKGTINLATGYARLQSKITLKESTLVFITLHMGEHNFLGGIKPFVSPENFEQITEDIWSSFNQNNLPELILGIYRYFGFHTYSLGHLFKDGKRKVLYNVLNDALNEVSFEYQQLYKRFYSLVTIMKESNISPPPSLELPIQFTLNNKLLSCFSISDYDTNQVKHIIGELLKGRYQPDKKNLSLYAKESIAIQIKDISINPFDINKIIKVNQFFSLINPLKLNLDLQICQNMYFKIGVMMCPRMEIEKESGDNIAADWLEQYIILGEHLGVKC
ncbi:MAG: DUF3536 domain-containing protein [Methanomicrobiales archaeon]|mgnify:CR=1 FL=1|nr:DUF3536 domain-containing protein [Methanomicrobiales archaeon]